MMIISKCDLWSFNSFLLIWPGDLFLDPMWPSFKLDLEFIKTNILSKIHDYCFKNVTARVITRFYADLARWPSFWPQVFQFQTWPRNHRQTFWARFMMIAWKMWPLECYLFVLRFYGPVNPVGSCWERSVYLTTRLLGRLSPLSG